MARCVNFHCPGISVGRSREFSLGEILSLRDLSMRSTGIAEMSFADASPDLSMEKTLARVLRYWSAKIS